MENFSELTILLLLVSFTGSPQWKHQLGQIDSNIDMNDEILFENVQEKPFSSECLWKCCPRDQKAPTTSSFACYYYKSHHPWG